MMKRLFWFTLGVGAGAAGALYAQRRIQRTVKRYTPPAIADRMTTAMKQFGADVADSARAGRTAMAERETQLRRDRRHHRAETPTSA
ncbi:MAG: hypothetical protein ACOYN3_02520 [Acidimicrobiia bacterium]